MKKNKAMKWLTIVILVIATISLVAGSFIMLLGQGTQPQAQHQAQTSTTPTE